MTDRAPDCLVRPALRQERASLRRLLDMHFEELSAFAPVDRAYPWFDLYFSAADRWAWLAEVEGRAAGFALVNRHAESGLPVDRVMAEFFILPGFRRQNVGRRFAEGVFSAAPGQWELAVLRANEPGLAFWSSVCRGYGPLRRIETAEETILRFSVALPPPAV